MSLIQRKPIKYTSKKGLNFRIDIFKEDSGYRVIVKLDRNVDGEIEHSEAINKFIFFSQASDETINDVIFSECESFD